MSRPQCDHRAPSTGRRAFGRQCTRRASFHASYPDRDGGANFCQRHASERGGFGMKVVKLPEPLGRCQCTGGDVPHRGAEEHLTGKPAQPSGATIVRGRRHHWRCTRSASVQLQRVVSTEGRLIPKAERVPRSYCAGCALAIQRYQLGEVERAS